MEEKITLKKKISDTVSTAKKYWHEPPKGNYIPYKEVAYLSGAGFGVHWLTLLASTIGLNASNFLVGASIGLKPMDLQIMLIVANLIGIPLGIFRAWYFDNHNLKGGKFLPFIRMTAVPIVLISLVFVWLPYENWDYITKAVVVEAMYLLLNVFLSFYTESYNYFQQIVSPDSNERSTVMSISQIVYSLAPTISNLLIPMIAGWTWGLDNIWSYRVIYPAFSIIGLVFSVVFFRKVKERLILPKRKPEPVRIIDAVREVAKNKYYWLIQAANWVVFLESGYGVILGWSFVYGNEGRYESMFGVASTVIGNAALWSMMATPFVIRAIGKRNLLIAVNTINAIVIGAMYFCYENIILVCALWYFNTFVSTSWNIVQHNISADMRDYHQWKTGVRIDGLFGPLGMIGTVIGFATGMFYPAIYEKMGIQEDYSVLYNDSLRNNLIEIIIVWSVIGAVLNLIPFLFYDLTEEKQQGYADVLRIRAMFEDYGNGVLDDGQLEEGMNIIERARLYLNKEKQPVDKSALRKARRLPKKTDEEKTQRYYAIKEAKKDIDAQRDGNIFAVTAPFIMDEINKFSTERYIRQIAAAEKTVAVGMLYLWDNLGEEKAKAKALPKKTKKEKEIRSDALELVRRKKEARRIILKYGGENLAPADEKLRQELQERETSSFSESMKVRKQLRELLKQDSLYRRANLPYTNAVRLIEQKENYSCIDKLEERYRLKAEEN